MDFLQKWPFFGSFFFSQFKPAKCPLRHFSAKCPLWHFSIFFWIFSKNGHSPIFFFRQYRPRKCLLWHSRTKIAFLGYKNKNFKKSKIWRFFIFSPKMAIFPSFFLGNIGHENVFYDILERQIDFLGYKNKKFQKSKNWHFPMGLTHGFGLKMPIFRTLFL